MNKEIELKILNAQKKKMLNKSTKTIEKFIEIQNKLNEIEFEIKRLESEE